MDNPIFKNMKKLLEQKSEQVNELKKRLGKYESVDWLMLNYFYFMKLSFINEL